jgi:glucose-1-phosphate thymidylyltransferase
MKGILLAGGNGTRLWPITKSVSKQLIPVYDKPLIYYPLATLMLANIKDILIITTPQDSNQFKRLLGSGNQFGIRLEYATQEKPNGIAEAFNIGSDFIKDQNVCLILGDNIFHGSGLGRQLSKFNDLTNAQIFGYKSNNPSAYGVIEFDHLFNVVSLEEKPTVPKSNYIVPGMYFYPSNVLEIVKTLKPSPRGELEITDLNNVYIEMGKLKCNLLEADSVWFDSGTFTSLNEASDYFRNLESVFGSKAGCLEEVALRKKYITRNQFIDLISEYPDNEYRQYLEKFITTDNY